MTDRIDLDALDVSTDDDEPTPNRGDWFWKGEGDPDEEPQLPDESDDMAGDADGDPATSSSDEGDDDSPAPTLSGSTSTHSPTPRVPRESDGKPVGIPQASGGGGGTAAKDRQEEPGEAPYGDPYGDTTADMTMAFTYEALKRLEHLHASLADAESWSDYVGLVGEVPAHVINKFQRDQMLDFDFFNGAGTGPGERLAEVDQHSMFYAERMVVVGLDDERWIADEGGWEFVPLPEAAAKSDWALVDEDAADTDGTDDTNDTDGTDDAEGDVFGVGGGDLDSR
jgi:hypothetical protein